MLRGNRSLLISGSIIALLSLSFWSSGVFLIRGLSGYGFLSSPLAILALFAASLPLAHVSIYAVRRMTDALYRNSSSLILASVLLMHSLALVVTPSLYGLIPSSALSAAAWLLWFGGVATVLIARTSNR
jgi:hypothetical protein